MVEYLSDDKIAECKEVFDLFDKDNDGKIGIKELEDILKAVGGNTSIDHLGKYIDQIRKDFGGSVNFSEFLNLFVEFKDPIVEEDIADGFDIFDIKKRGKIDLSHLKKLLTSIGDPLTEDEMFELEENINAFPRDSIDSFNNSPLISQNNPNTANSNTNINDITGQFYSNDKNMISKSTFIKLMLNQIPEKKINPNNKNSSSTMK